MKIVTFMYEEKRRGNIMQKRLSDRVVDDILTMIVIEKSFYQGRSLPIK